MSNFQTEALDCTLCADEMLFKTHLCCSLLKDGLFVSGSWHNICHKKVVKNFGKCKSICQWANRKFVSKLTHAHINQGKNVNIFCSHRFLVKAAGMSTHLALGKLHLEYMYN